MPVFNWIQADFADGRDFVSDAPDDVVQAMGRALPTQPGAFGRCDFGNFRIETAAGSRACSYLRFTGSVDPPSSYVHVIVLDSGVAEPRLSEVEALFSSRYGHPLEASLGELVGRLARQPIAQATLPLTEYFVAETEFERPKSVSVETRKPARSPRVGSSTLPWLLATLAVAFAAFLAGRVPTTGPAPPSVGAPPPDFDLARRVARLEEDRGAAGISLRAQLEYERRQHRRRLADKEDELRELAMQLEAMRGTSDSSSISATVPKMIASVPSSIAAAPPAVLTPGPSLEPSRPRVSRRRPADPTDRATVLADLLWVRGGPGVEYARISALDGGTGVELAGGIEQGWVEISAPEQGWVASEFLDLPVPEDALDSVRVPAAVPADSIPDVFVETPPTD